MVVNFLRGGTAVNVVARELGARVVVAGLGVAADLPANPAMRIRRGTQNIVHGPAMTLDQAVAALRAGRVLVRSQAETGLDVALTGDLGIANTTPSSCLICHFTGLDPASVVGRGTGIDDAGLARKQAAVRRALEVNREAAAEPLGALAALGGFEIAGLVGVILESAALRRPVVIDGFIAPAAAHTAAALAPGCVSYMIAAHRSQELGHAAALASLGLRPLLDLPLLRTAMRVLNDMATFGEAGVSNREDREERPGPR